MAFIINTPENRGNGGNGSKYSAEDIIEAVEKEILPKIILGLKIPEHDLDLRVREKVEGRKRIRYRREPSTFGKIKWKRSVLHQLQLDLKHTWDADSSVSNGVAHEWGHSVSSVQSIYPGFHHDNIDTHSNGGLNGKETRDPSTLSDKGISEYGHSLELEPSLELLQPQTENVMAPLLDPFPHQESTVSFGADAKIRDLCIKDPLFKEVLEHIREVLSKRLDSLKDLRIDGRPLSNQFIFKMTLEMDMEVPSWNTVHIRVKVPEISFDMKMKIWNWVEDLVRNEIRKIRSEHMGNPTMRRRIEDIDKRFFVNITL